ncbi:MAG: hypothetical protein J7L66_05055 [Anaerolineaceae bacterium]|nr:hypothetical protein [Anaerolineaceae bacterium]
MTAWKTPFSNTEHPFSIASSVERKGNLEMSIKNLGAFTEKIRSLKTGDRVCIHGPFGTFHLNHYPDAKRLVFIPGRIGVTPIISMLRTMADRKDKRPILLFCCNRGWDSVTFREEVKELESRLNLTTIYTIEKPPKQWSGEASFLDRKILKRYIPKDWYQKGTHIFLCGPTPMMNAVDRELLAVGYTFKQIHSERFSFS